MTLSSKEGKFVVDGYQAFLLADTVWSSLIDATDDEWSFYLKHRAKQGFNAALVSVLPILHDRSAQAGGLAPFDEERVEANGGWHFNAGYFDRLGDRLGTAARTGITVGLVLLWVNYVPGTWGAGRTPGCVMPEPVWDEYLAYLSAVVKDGECLLIVSGDPAFSSREEVTSYRSFAERVRQVWPQSLIAFHSAPTATLPPELDDLADAMIFQSGHHGEMPHLARELAARYRLGSKTRPVMNAEPAYEGHRVGGGVGRFGRAIVRRRIWESVAGGASEGVTYGAHGLWGWHRGGAQFSSTHFSGVPLDWREALFLPGSEDAVVCRRLMESARLACLEVQPDRLKVADEGWGHDEVVASTTSDGARGLVYLPYGGPVTLEVPGEMEVGQLVSLPDGDTVPTAAQSKGDHRYIIDPPGDVSECVIFLELH
jgi:hypothetical protein